MREWGGEVGCRNERDASGLALVDATRPSHGEGSADRAKAFRGRGLNGAHLARHFGVEARSTMDVRRPGGSGLVVTHLRGWVGDGFRTAPLREEPAFSIVLQLRDLPHHDLRLGGRLVHTGAVPAGAVSALSLADLPRSEMRGTFEALQLYVPEALFDELAQEEGLCRPRRLRWPRDEPDPVAASLGALLLPALDHAEEWRAMYVEQIALAFLSHAAVRYGDGRVACPAEHGFLAPWQERRAKEMMRASLGTKLTMAEVSRACRLSTTYFAAAFRRSTGRTPHRFFSELRVEEAKRLMLATNLPLADVALLCGFGDQSHFTRVFAKIIGTSPGSWQRMNRIHRPLSSGHFITR